MKTLFKYACLGLFCGALSLPQTGHTSDLTFSGDVSIGANSIDDDIGIARVDAMVSLRLFDINARPVRFEFGTFAYFLKGDRPHETYAAIAYDDRWRVGVVRPAYDTVLPSVFEFTAPFVANTRAEYTRARATTEAMRFNSVPVGLSYTDTRGDVTWAVSIHDASDGNFRSASTGIAWQRDALQLAVAAEGVWDPKDSFEGINAKTGLRWSGDRIELGVAYLHPDANQRPDAVSLDVGYGLTDRFTVSTFGEFTEHKRDRAYGLAGRYDIDDGSDVAVATTGTQQSYDFHLTYNRRY